MKVFKVLGFLFLLFFTAFGSLAFSAKLTIEKVQDETWFLGLPYDSTSVIRLYELSDSLAHESSELSRLAAELGIRISEAISYDLYLGKLYSCMGRNYYQQADPAKALEYCFKNLEFNRKRNDTLHVAQAYGNIALVYMRNQRYQEALEYLRKAEEIYLLSNVKSDLPGIYNKIGGCYNHQGQHEDGGHYLLKSYHLAVELGTKEQALYASNNLCNHFTTLEAYDDAKTYAFKTIQLADEIRNKSYQAMAYQSLGQLLFNQREFTAAYDWYFKAYELYQEIGMRYEEVQLMDNLSECLEFSGKSKEALVWLKRFKSRSDSLLTMEKTHAMAEQDRKFHIRQKNEAIHALSLENKAKEAELAKAETERNLLLMVGVLVLSFVVVGFLHYQSKARLNKLLQSKNKQIALQNQRIEEQNQVLRKANNSLQLENIQAQFEILRNQVNPHFLFNSLNTLASIIPNHPQKAVNFTHEFAKLFRKVLEYKNQNLISLREELELVGRYLYLQTTRFGDKLQVNQNLDAARLDDFVPPFCLQMLLENAIKHNEISDEKPLQIDLFTEGQQLCVSNNIQLRNTKPESTGIGLENIRKRYEILTRLKPVFEKKGDRFEVRIPLLQSEVCYEVTD